MEFFSQPESYTDAVIQLDFGHSINNGYYKESHPKTICKFEWKNVVFHL